MVLYIITNRQQQRLKIIIAFECFIVQQILIVHFFLFEIRNWLRQSQSRTGQFQRASEIDARRHWEHFSRPQSQQQPSEFKNHHQRPPRTRTRTGTRTGTGTGSQIRKYSILDGDASEHGERGEEGEQQRSGRRSALEWTAPGRRRRSRARLRRLLRPRRFQRRSPALGRRGGSQKVADCALPHRTVARLSLSAQRSTAVQRRSVTYCPFYSSSSISSACFFALKGICKVPFQLLCL